MEVIKQSYKIIKFPEEALKDIEIAGRTCYKSQDKITDDSAIGFSERLINRKHLPMIEFADVTVRFITDRGVTHELVRHRLCSFAQESTRYVNYKEGMEVILPVEFSEVYASRYVHKNDCIYVKGVKELQESNDNLKFVIWRNLMNSSESSYKDMLKLGCKPQLVRAVLPNSLKTEIVVKASLREWRHIFNMRCAKSAHPQIRALMLPLLDELSQRIPIIFDDLKEKYICPTD